MEKEDSQIGTIKPWMFRVGGEYAALFFSIVIVLIIGALFSLLDLYIFIFLVLGAVLYVQLSQAQYLGSSIRVHNKQFPELFERFKSYAKRLNISRAALYIKQDPYLNAYTIGLTSCTVVLTSSLMEQLTEKELDFVIGHELGHYRAGHTKISTFVVPIGSNNIVSDFIFGFWNRRCEFTSDRCGLILTKDIDHAISALIKLSIGNILYQKLDMAGYLRQIMTADKTMVKLSEMLGSHPLTTSRLKELLKFWKENFIVQKNATQI